ncbi:MAG: hypothetical protein HYY84_17250 [Deltaproteobacteria bacterium]|nr:hypothetical protein [Deltaproteobacteria bacterium]
MKNRNRFPPLAFFATPRLFVFVLSLALVRCGATAPWDDPSPIQDTSSPRSRGGASSTGSISPGGAPTDAKGGCVLSPVRSPIDFGTIPPDESQFATVGVVAAGPNGTCRVTRVLKGAGLSANVFVAITVDGKTTLAPFEIATPLGARRFDLIVFVRASETSESGSIHIEYESPARSLEIIVRVRRSH